MTDFFEVYQYRRVYQGGQHDVYCNGTWHFVTRGGGHAAASPIYGLRLPFKCDCAKYNQAKENQLTNSTAIPATDSQVVYPTEAQREMAEFDFIKSFDKMQEMIGLDNYERGFKDAGVVSNPLYVPTKLALVVTEVAEAIEAHRNPGTQDQHLIGRMGLGVELADAVIRLMDLADDLDIPLGQIIVEKLAFNRSRPVRHGGKLY